MTAPWSPSAAREAARADLAERLRAPVQLPAAIATLRRWLDNEGRRFERPRWVAKLAELLGAENAPALWALTAEIRRGG